MFSAQSVPVLEQSSAVSSAQRSLSLVAPSSAPLVAQGPLPVDVLPEKAVCGDGVTEAGEECDDSNLRSFDGCSSDCLFERGYCGDGTVQLLLGEQCEPSVHSPNLSYGCSTACRFLSSLCGNGVLDEGEQCDQGLKNSNAPNAYCRTDCGLARCGDRIVDAASETCDDGNRLGADGCSASCAVERAAPSALTAQMFLLPRSASSVPAIGQPYVQMWQATPPQTTASGPGALAIMAAGAGAGLAYVRRKKRQ